MLDTGSSTTHSIISAAELDERLKNDIKKHIEQKSTVLSEIQKIDIDILRLRSRRLELMAQLEELKAKNPSRIGGFMEMMCGIRGTRNKQC